MKIPHDQLSPDTLQALIEEFVCREGTDYGDREFSLADKVAQVQRQLERAEVVICFDSYLQSITIVTEQTYRSNNELQQ